MLALVSDALRGSCCCIGSVAKFDGRKLLKRPVFHLPTVLPRTMHASWSTVTHSTDASNWRGQHWAGMAAVPLGICFSCCCTLHRVGVVPGSDRSNPFAHFCILCSQTIVGSIWSSYVAVGAYSSCGEMHSGVGISPGDGQTLTPPKDNFWKISLLWHRDCWDIVAGCVQLWSGRVRVCPTWSKSASTCLDCHPLTPTPELCSYVASPMWANPVL